MSTQHDTTPSVIVEAGKSTPPSAYYAAVWHEPKPEGGTKPAKKRIGPAWLDYAGPDENGRPTWAKRPGRVRDGHFDERRAHAAAPGIVVEWRQVQAAKALPARRADTVTIRELAGEWLHWFEHVKGASPSTVAGYSHMLSEPGPAKKGTSKALEARILTRFGDRAAAGITTQEFDEFLAELDKTLAARSVNLYRQVLCNLYVYAAKRGTYGMAVNPAKDTDRRRVPPPAPLDYLEVEEVEALARAAANGLHRKPRGRENPDHDGPDQPALLTKQQQADQLREQAARRAQDQQDAEMFRVLLYSGMRIGEALALRWGNVAYLADMSGGVLDVRHAVSAGTEKPPKSWKPRTVPLVRPAAESLARLQNRDHFVSDDDYVFVNDIGGRLEYSALRRRYHAAREAAGLRNVKLHGLRHAAGSIMAAGMPLATVRDMLGHAQMTTTNRYLHGKADARAVAALNAAFGVAPVETPAEADISTPQR